MFSVENTSFYLRHNSKCVILVDDIMISVETLRSAI